MEMIGIDDGKIGFCGGLWWKNLNIFLLNLDGNFKFVNLNQWKILLHSLNNFQTLLVATQKWNWLHVQAAMHEDQTD